MSDTTLLLTGVVVFSLMLAAIVMTVMEFKQIGKNQEAVRGRHSKKKPGDK